MVNNLKEALIERDGLTGSQADMAIREAQDELFDMLQQGDLYRAEYICEELFGLEPDYIFDLI